VQLARCLNGQCVTCLTDAVFHAQQSREARKLMVHLRCASEQLESILKAEEVSFLSHTLEKPQQPEFCSVQAERISVGAFASPRINELCKVALAGIMAMQMIACAAGPLTKESSKVRT
jgi:hypothetical protein